MQKKDTHDRGVRLVRKKLEERWKQREFVIADTDDKKRVAFTVAKSGFAEKAVQVHACVDNDGGNCYSFDKDEGKARNKAKQVPFRIFVKLNGDKIIVPSFVWHCDDEHLIDKHGSKWGLYPYRQDAHHGWQKRKGEAGWNWIETVLNRIATPK